MDNLYREIILEHWKHPQNYGELQSPTFRLEARNKYCGDSVVFSGTIDGGELKDVGFVGQGCAISISNASIMSEHIKGMKVKDILDISQEEYLEMVGLELGATRLTCSLFIYTTLIKALTT